MNVLIFLAKKEAIGGKLPRSLSSTIGRQHASFRTNIHKNVVCNIHNTFQKTFFYKSPVGL